MFTRILIANRGEIACRIIKTAQSMGIYTLAIYSSADKDSLHVQLADAACFIGPAPAKDSYLNCEAIIQAAKAHHIEAIHPGYGFLSENPKFAQACEEAGIIFIGPSLDALNIMGSKQLAKQKLEKTKVPLTPGYHGSDQNESTLLKEAKHIGFPVLIKAANGGGGKGMRAVYKEEDFQAALAGAKREALASFDSDTMIIEKLVLNPRHIEVQIMADAHGNVVHLFERDCSIQRRHQKIIEEAPAPDLSPQMRHEMTKAACEVALSINYKGAGTVEFLYDGHNAFYFMEMNTRLQVEHPVTEMITGLDLVAWQLKIAANELLPLSQDEIRTDGHALECRVYAEDPENGFLPSIGHLHFLKEPKGEGIRVDSGVISGSDITQYYDPMIAKLIAWGCNREEALQRMNRALSQYYIGGVKSNIPFLQAICNHKNFKKAQLNTHFLSDESIEIRSPDRNQALLLAIGFDYINLQNTNTDPLLKDTFSWQMHETRHSIWRYQEEDGVIEAHVTAIDTNQFHLKLNNEQYTINAYFDGHYLRIETQGQSYKALPQNQDSKLILYSEQGQSTIERFQWNKIQAHSKSHKNQLTAPMPATIVAILKHKGEAVKAGERLIILEAMKMEHTIHAPIDGVLSDVFFSVGAQVSEGAELLSLSESD